MNINGNLLNKTWKGLKQISEGLKNSLITKDSIEEIAAKRNEICQNCPHRKNDKCGVCGCFIHLKTRCLSCECPKFFWLAEVDEKEEELIDKYLNDENNK